MSALWVDEGYDRSHAGVGKSRYGEYLRLNQRLFYDDNDAGDGDWTGDGDTAWFTTAAWKVASSPIMGPAYIQHHERVVNVQVEGMLNEAGVLVTVSLVAPWPVSLPVDWQGWDHSTSWGENRFTAPEENQLAALGHLDLTVPIPAARLYRPTRGRARAGQPGRGGPHVEDAKAALHRAISLVNRHVDPVLERLIDAGRPR